MSYQPRTQHFMESDPIWENSNTGDPASYAYPTARTRWPKIWSTAIEEVRTTCQKEDVSPEDSLAGQIIIAKLEGLKAALAGNDTLEPILPDGGTDIDGYNEELRTLGNLTWLSSPWLFAECYIYRLAHSFFSTSTPFWETRDIFFTEKRDSLVASHVATFELVKRFRAILDSLQKKDSHLTDDGTQAALFDEIVQIVLWGNATDLTLLSSLAVDEVQSRQGQRAREASRANIVVNDSEGVWNLLQSLRNESTPSSGVIHIVLDNAGFELLADLVFAGYLIESKFANKIVLHGKCMPWFVSDVNARDFESLLDCFTDGTYYPQATAEERQDVQIVGKYWQDLQKSGKLEFYAHAFWTTQHSFGRMPALEPALFAQLAEGDLVVFKGDLNYRKLVYDGMWPSTTPFQEALGPFASSHGGKGVRTLVLRTCKADVCVGLGAGQEETLDKGWTRYGHYGVINYWDAKVTAA